MGRVFGFMRGAPAKSNVCGLPYKRYRTANEIVIAKYSNEVAAATRR